VFHQKPDDTRRLAESSEAKVTIERSEAVTHSFRVSILGMHGMKAR